MNKHTKTFAEYMGFEIVRVGYFGSESETKWQLDNEEWMNDVGLKSVGTYAVNKSDNSWYSYEDLAYTTSWDWLLPVWNKASTEIFGQKELMAKCMMTICDVNIEKTVANLYKLIKSI